MKVYPENKKHDLCVISIENQFLVSFSLDPALYYATPRHNPRSDFFKKMVLNRVQGLKEKSHEVSARKNNNRLRYNKNVEGADSPPGSFRVKRTVATFLFDSRNSWHKRYPSFPLILLFIWKITFKISINKKRYSDDLYLYIHCNHSKV